MDKDKKSKDDLSTLRKTTPTGQEVESTVDKKATSAVKLALNFDDESIDIDQIHEEMDRIKADINSDVKQALVSRSGGLELFEMPAEMVAYERARADNNVGRTDAKIALESLKSAASAWNEGLVSFIDRGLQDSKKKNQDVTENDALKLATEMSIQCNENMMKMQAQMNMLTQRMLDMDRKKKKKKRSKKEKMDDDSSKSSSDESSSDEASSSSSEDSVEESRESNSTINVSMNNNNLTIRCERLTGSNVRRIATLKEVPSEKLVKELQAFIIHCENGDSEKAEDSLAIVYKEAGNDLVLTPDGVGKVPLHAAMKGGEFKSSSQVNLLQEVTAQALSGTGIIGRGNIKEDDAINHEPGMDFEQQPLDQAKYVGDAIAKAAMAREFCPGIDRTADGKISIDSEVVMALEERRIAQTRIYNAFEKVLTKSHLSDSLANCESYLGFLKFVKDCITEKKGIVPAGCYERPTEITVVLSAVKPGMFTGSYLIAAVQKFNSEVAASRYFNVMTKFLTPEGLIKKGEGAQGYINRILTLLSNAKKQTPPTDLSKLGIVNNDRDNHPFLDDRIVVLILVQQLYQVLGTQPGGKEVRSYITEDMYKSSLEGQLTLPELEAAIHTMTKDKVGLGKKEKVPQTQTFSYNQRETKNRDQPPDRSRSQSRNSTRGKGKDNMDGTYKEAVESLGKNFEELKNKMMNFNSRFKDEFKKDLFTHVKNKPFAEVKVNSDIAKGWFNFPRDWYMRLSEKDRSFLSLLQDLFGQGKEGTLTRRGIYYQQNNDKKWSIKLTQWRQKHNITPRNPKLDSSQALSSDIKTEKKTKSSKRSKKSKRKASASSSESEDDTSVSRSSYSSGGFDDDADDDDEN